MARDALLVAVPRTSLEGWRAWVATLPRGPIRLEPPLSAWVRALRWGRRHDAEAPPTAFLLGEAGSSLIAILAGTRVLIARTLVPAGESPHRWQGEDGLRTLRETLLAAEDRHPWLRIQHLVSFGAVEEAWVNEAAAVTGLSVAERPDPPEGVTGELRSHGDWAVPFGTVLGTTAR